MALADCVNSGAFAKKEVVFAKHYIKAGALHQITHWSFDTGEIGNTQASD